MILFRYTKVDGAEYISHLDLFRQIDRTFRRAGIPVAMEGMGNHPKIFMNAPLGTGIQSLAEYCCADAAYDGDFIRIFNENAPKGVRCTAWTTVEKKVNLPVLIAWCDYRIEGLAHFDEEALLAEPEIVLTDKRDRVVEIRSKIHALYWDNGILCATLRSGNQTLRPDVLGEYLAARFGGKCGTIVKTTAKQEDMRELLK